MNDNDYKRAIFDVLRAEETLADLKDRVTEEAVKRDEAYVLHAWYYHSLVEWPYLSLSDAVERAQGDCSPVKIVGPGGKVFDPFTGEPVTEAVSK